MLPHVYSDAAVVRQVLEDYEQADIPLAHKLCWRWTERFVRCSWESTPAQIDELRAAGLPDREIVNWAESACVQTWWVMSADAGGVELDAFTPASAKRTVGLERAAYEAATRPTAAALGAPLPTPCATAENGIAWVDVDLDDPGFQAAAQWGRERYGFVPNFFKAVSLRPALYPRHQRAFALLEGPVTASLTPRHHAMVRALVSSLNRSSYGARTSRALLERRGEPGLWERVTGDYLRHDWSEADRAVLDFVAKMARSSYKVTAKDAVRFDSVGLDAAAYVEVANVVSIQTSIERVANALGVVSDEGPLLTV